MGELADNGGPTWTHAFGALSPAVEAGDPSIAATTDQRNGPRALDGDLDGTARADVGACEYLAGFFVDSIIDSPDNVLGDGIAEDASGNRTLRAAVMEANALAGDDVIVLAAGVYALALAGRR